MDSVQRALGCSLADLPTAVAARNETYGCVGWYDYGARPPI
jgi:hypothetical protein